MLTEDREVADYFETMLAAGLRNHKTAANWVMTEVLRVSTRAEARLPRPRRPPAEIGRAAEDGRGGTLSLNAAKTAFAAMCKSGKGADATVSELGLVQVSDEGAIAAACDKIIAAEPDKVAEYRAGRDKLFGFFFGQVMKSMGGKGNPQVVNEILQAKLAG